MKRITIEDVAALAGVSRQTVSRVVNGGNSVAPRTYARVNEIIQTLDYRPDPVARSFVTRRTHSIAVVAERYSGSVYPLILEGIESYCRANGYDLFIAGCNHSPNGEPLEAPGLVNQRPEAYIFAYHGSTNDTFEIFDKIKYTIPIITNGYAANLDQVFAINIDNRAAARGGARYLLDRGYRSFGIIAGPAYLFDTIERNKGFLESSLEAGIDAPCEYGSAWNPRAGYEAAARFLEKHELPEAIFAHSDTIAIGVMALLRERGLRVPEDVAIMGFNDISIAPYFSPPLTTICYPAFNMGLLIAKATIRSIEGFAREDLLSVEDWATIEGKVVPRQSA